MIAIFAPLAFVLVLSLGVNKLSTQAAQALFWVFCAAMGASLVNIFLVYTSESIARVFFITAATFGATSLYGYTTRADLSRMGSFLMMGLFGARPTSEDGKAVNPLLAFGLGTSDKGERSAWAPNRPDMNTSASTLGQRRYRAALPVPAVVAILSKDSAVKPVRASACRVAR